jgi:hypothetical protein
LGFEGVYRDWVCYDILLIMSVYYSKLSIKLQYFNLFPIVFICGCLSNKPSDSAEEFNHECFQKPAVLDLGEGELEFQSFNDEMEATMVHGPQGGWHILASFQLENALQILDVEFTIIHLPTGELISDNSYRLAMILEEDCIGYYPGLYGYINIANLIDGEVDTPPEILAYDPIVMKMRINDCGLAQQAEGVCNPEERWIEKSLELIAVPDPIDID